MTSTPSTSSSGSRGGREAGPGTPVASWREFESAEPDFGRYARERFASFRHHVLATVRADGSPRVSGIETSFCLDELWLGGMPGARKSADLQRDPRFALHANPGPGTDLDGGDIRVAGRAVCVDDPVIRRHFVEEISPPVPFDLFRVEITQVVRIRVAGEELVIETWRPGGHGLRVLRRGNDAAADPADEEAVTHNTP
ncbi:Pyridoxamine 5'-phosphate oxidase [Frankia sp. EI5c]|uniref:pyridoxamine 5'-phosphate oxidase family protein n=1 Tax=Frankia sp. EI5c TaxID=683316 RepID=UPI0007C21308|nr:pyridoxamine 5'-phosphate oxidase family protein [Frankia sp. EI5c]OAA28173.1 Pyridoxamine 5'-phosphate oxidase [Frankia sp. EI5c]